MSLIHWVGLGVGTPKDRDEFNNRDVCECDGWVWELDAIGAPSILRVTRKAAAFASSSPHFHLLRMRIEAFFFKEKSSVWFLRQSIVNKQVRKREKEVRYLRIFWRTMLSAFCSFGMRSILLICWALALFPAPSAGFSGPSAGLAHDLSRGGKMRLSASARRTLQVCTFSMQAEAPRPSGGGSG